MAQENLNNWDWPNTEFENVSDEELLMCLKYWEDNHAFASSDYKAEIEEELQRRTNSPDSSTN